MSTKVALNSAVAFFVMPSTHLDLLPRRTIFTLEVKVSLSTPWRHRGKQRPSSNHSQPRH